VFQLLKSVTDSKEKSASWKDILQDKSILKPTLIAVVLMVFQQLAAIDAVMFYTVDIFREAGTDIDENLSANIVGGVQVVWRSLLCFLIDFSPVMHAKKFLTQILKFSYILKHVSSGNKR